MVGIVWRDAWAAGAAGDVEDGSYVRVVRQVPRYRNGATGRPYWVVNIAPLHRPELTLPEAFESREAAKAGAEEWFATNPRPEGPRRKVWRRVPNQPD